MYDSEEKEAKLKFDSPGTTFGGIWENTGDIVLS
jgi:hypothetical protein